MVVTFAAGFSLWVSSETKLMSALVLHFIINMNRLPLEVIHVALFCLFLVCIYTTNVLERAADNNVFSGPGNVAQRTRKAVYVVATNRRIGVPPETEIEQRGQQTHDHDTHIVEYYVEEHGGEDSNVTYPPFVEHSPENGPGRAWDVYTWISMVSVMVPACFLVKCLIY